jgi:hypothetical protein
MSDSDLQSLDEMKSHVQLWVATHESTSSSSSSATSGITRVIVHLESWKVVRCWVTELYERPTLSFRISTFTSGWPPSLSPRWRSRTCWVSNFEYISHKGQPQCFTLALNVSFRTMRPIYVGYFGFPHLSPFGGDPLGFTAFQKAFSEVATQKWRPS